ncbi:chemotaxis protein CheW [Lacipirellula parvula]|uniref:histidine kinase n=1 Tax=Lacipirellula parvula TaxID=2650471 RepID=A0A5K7XPE0_9BACT|nr:chemotaxis protein CheW [Lacipirellula parvula]BBO35209.1 signal transduction histidine kinase CheA [Lacipirellula parvula]
MSSDDQALILEFVTESRDHLGHVESQLLQIEANGANIDVDLVNEVFRGIHSIKGAAGFLGLVTVNKLAHSLENVLGLIRTRELSPTTSMVEAMLKAADTLSELVNNVDASNEINVDEHLQILDAIASSDVLDITLDPVDFSVSPPSDEEKSDAVEAIDRKEEPVISGIVNAGATASPETSIRVQVGVLDSLMNLAGELVLGRNQLIQALNTDAHVGIEAVASRLDQVTTELQEAIMRTRMQPIGAVFSKFPRVVRDLSAKLGKQCDVIMDGKEVDVDKTILEAIGDPLTHLVRNSIDHGVERPDVRVAAGKPANGTIHLKAYHEAGKVRIDIADDGGGIYPEKLKKKAVEKGVVTAEQASRLTDREAIRLIFHPGFSTAEKITDVSGRGVGMDVVRTNIEKLGGTVDVDSTPGRGTTIQITLPLTLAIIPSLIIQSGEERFAIPQVNISELVRLRREEMAKRLDMVKSAEVLRLRGSLLPLVRLRDVLGFVAPSIATTSDDSQLTTNIIVVESGQQRFGIVVDALHDSEEIVVKPLGRHIKNAPCLSGATILGDGHVALILDVAGIAAHEQIRSTHDEVIASKGEELATGEADLQSVLLFTNHPREHFAVSMDVVARIERIRTDQIDAVGGQELVQYRQSSVPLLRLENLISARASEPQNWVYVIVFVISGKEVGLVAPRLEDIREVPTNVDTLTFQEVGVQGSLVLADQATRLIDLFKIAEKAHPEWFANRPKPLTEPGKAPVVLLAEDSNFFRKQVKSMIEEQGYVVFDCEDGLLAWNRLNEEKLEIDVVVTDIEMPNLNGFELCQRIKQSNHWGHVPVIALTSLAGASDMQRGMDVGIDDYQIKMDREKLLTSLHNFTGAKAGSNQRRLQPA